MMIVTPLTTVKKRHFQLISTETLLKCKQEKEYRFGCIFYYHFILNDKVNVRLLFSMREIDNTGQTAPTSYYKPKTIASISK